MERRSGRYNGELRRRGLPEDGGLGVRVRRQIRGVGAVVPERRVSYRRSSWPGRQDPRPREPGGPHRVSASAACAATARTRTRSRWAPRGVPAALRLRRRRHGHAAELLHLPVQGRAQVHRLEPPLVSLRARGHRRPPGDRRSTWPTRVRGCSPACTSSRTSSAAGSSAGAWSCPASTSPRSARTPCPTSSPCSAASWPRSASATAARRRSSSAATTAPATLVTASGFVTVARHERAVRGRGRARRRRAARWSRTARKLHEAAIAASPPVLERGAAASGARSSATSITSSRTRPPAGPSPRPSYSSGAVSAAPRNVVVNVEDYGNTASTSHFLALYRLLQEGQLAHGENVMLVALASGLVMGVVGFTVDGLVERYG